MLTFLFFLHIFCWAYLIDSFLTFSVHFLHPSSLHIASSSLPSLYHNYLPPLSHIFHLVSPPCILILPQYIIPSLPIFSQSADHPDSLSLLDVYIPIFSSISVLLINSSFQFSAVIQDVIASHWPLPHSKNS